jgi:hypothetical protein
MRAMNWPAARGVEGIVAVLDAARRADYQLPMNCAYPISITMSRGVAVGPEGMRVR